MACHFNENVYTTVFTPREYQVELLDTSKEGNTIVCLGNNNAKVFVAVKLLQELAAEVRRYSKTRSVFILDRENVEVMSSHIRNLTDLTVSQYENVEDVEQFTEDKWAEEVDSHQVLVMTSDICLLCITYEYFKLKDINLLVIDDCRLALKQNSLRQILKEYSTLPNTKRPRILGLTTTMLSQNFDPARLEAEFEYMEKVLHCTVDTSSDIVTVLRYCSKPCERLVICANPTSCTLTEKLDMYIRNAKVFLEDHRYDPYEIYEEEFHEELQEVPDPKVEPTCILDEFLEVLHSMGPWCADRAAFALLIKIENLKVKTPYERHFLLLCMVSSVLVNIRAICDQEFETLSDSESIYAYSTPRVLRLLQVLKSFKPDTPKKALLPIQSASIDNTQISSQSVVTSEVTAPTSSVLELETPNSSSSEVVATTSSMLTSVASTSSASEAVVTISSTLCTTEPSSPESTIETEAETSQLAEAETSTSQLTEIETSILQVPEVETSTSQISKEETSTLQISEVETSNLQIPEVDTLTSQISEVEKSTSQISEVDTSTSQISEVETSTSQISEVKTSTSQISEVKTSTSQISEAETLTSQISEVGMSVVQIPEVETSTPLISEVETLTSQTSEVETSTSQLSEEVTSNLKIPEEDTSTSQISEIETSTSQISEVVTVSSSPEVMEITSTIQETTSEIKSPEMGETTSPPPEVDAPASQKSEIEVPVSQIPEVVSPTSPTPGVETSVSPASETVESTAAVSETAESTSVIKSETTATSADTTIALSDLKVQTQTSTTNNVINVNVCDTSENAQNNSVKSSQELVNNSIAMRPWKGRMLRGHRKGGPNGRSRPNHSTDPDSLCAIVFVEKRFTAKILYYLINELCHCQEDFEFLSVQYTVEKIADPVTDNREAEIEHRKQEEVLKKFRMHECNLLIATSVLEEGIDIPKCNLVIRFDQPLTYNSYVQCKGRAKMPDAHYVLMSEEQKMEGLVRQLAKYLEIEKMLLKKCKNREPTELEEREADLYTSYIQPYSPENSPAKASVSVATAVALVNKYCAKLPSDTFTRLTPLWWMQTSIVDDTVMYICSIRLPINSPLKQTITGVPMPNRVLARRVAALHVCCLLHQMGELDDNLLPVGKESFKAFEDDWNNFPLEESDELLTKNNLEPRPGTTKRRQYYYKRVADALTDCRPLASVPAYLYLITMTLTCPLPEEQNTRGRKIYPPEDSAQGFGILTLKQIPKICPFPIFTRSGEVRVGLELASPTIIMTQEQLEKIMEFLNYIFTNVLRLQKYLMLFDPNASENSYFIVPTITNSGTTNVDWDFLNTIYENRNLTPHIIPETERKDFSFNPEMYQDAVVMPWYRNQDQPQYFYVAEICNHLNPKSSFPGTDYKTFEEYYFKKYGIQIQNLEQPLLDVDHTSARLNFLTPRYVNRKGVALPTSSEETKRAKRENLEQKQILVPELCTVHPFPASLWRKAVCLPCILYRINALLLADQIRKQVAEELALGQVELSPDFEWPPLNFGWSLSDVLKKSKESRTEKTAVKTPEHIKKKDELVITEITDDELKIEEITDKDGSDEKLSDDDEEVHDKDWMEIGTWSNEMASTSVDIEVDALMDDLPKNVTMCYRDNSWKQEKMGSVRYGSPTSWMQSACFDDYDSDDSCDSYSSEPESSDNSNKSGGLRIEFKSDFLAEAIDVEQSCANRALMLMAPDHSDLPESIDDDLEAVVLEHIESFTAAVDINEKCILSNGIIVPVNKDYKIEKKSEEAKPTDQQYELLIKSSLKLPDINIDCSQLYNDVNIENNIVITPTRNNEDNPEFEKINFKFSFDFQPDLKNHPGPSPSVILQALTMSNANDGINLERLETIGDSFLKYAITNYLYSTYDNIHEGKLSHLRSKQVSNLNLYRLGRLKVLGESMIATKFDPHDNWLPPCYYVPKELEQALIDARVPASHWNRADMPTVKDMSKDEICQMVREKGERLGVIINKQEENSDMDYKIMDVFNVESLPCFIPYNLITQHSIPDKSVADCVEALIGAYLIECGPRGALLFMAWLGIRVLPKTDTVRDDPDRPTGSLPSVETENGFKQVLYGELTCPRSPLLHNSPNAEEELEKLLDGYDEFERSIQYYFSDRSYLLQALTHASYSPNTVTDCYQRLEFLGDAVLDYLITRHLYEDPRLHSPGALTDLRSALVNNTIFASLAVRHGFHKYFRHLSPGLHDVVNRFVQIQEENGHSISEEYYLIAEDESEEIEDVEVPKALGDVFESVAGAIFLDSGMSLDAVWRVYYRMMRTEIEQFSTSVPKSPIRELLELEPETAKFGKPEKLADGRRVRVTVEVFGKGTFKGIGRNYRIAKCTAAKCALKQLKKRGLLVRKS